MNINAKGLKIEPEKLTELSARLREQISGNNPTADEAIRDAADELQRLADGFAEMKKRAAVAQVVAQAIGEGINAAISSALSEVCPCEECTAERASRPAAREAASNPSSPTKH